MLTRSSQSSSAWAFEWHCWNQEHVFHLEARCSWASSQVTFSWSEEVWFMLNVHVSCSAKCFMIWLYRFLWCKLLLTSSLQNSLLRWNYILIVVVEIKIAVLLEIACKSLIMLHYHQILDSIFLSTCFLSNSKVFIISFWNWMICRPYWSELMHLNFGVKGLFVDNIGNVNSDQGYYSFGFFN